MKQLGMKTKHGTLCIIQVIWHFQTYRMLKVKSKFSWKLSIWLLIIFFVSQWRIMLMFWDKELRIKLHKFWICFSLNLILAPCLNIENELLLIYICNKLSTAVEQNSCNVLVYVHEAHFMQHNLSVEFPFQALRSFCLKRGLPNQWLLWSAFLYNHFLSVVWQFTGAT